MRVNVGIERIDTSLSLPTSKYSDNAGWDAIAVEAMELPPISKQTVSLGEGVSINGVNVGGEDDYLEGVTPIKIPLNMKVAVPDGYFMRVVGRSGVSASGILIAPGTVDAGYRGQVFATAYNLTDKPYVVEKGERIAQVIVMPYAKVDWVERDINENETERKATGFGESGRF